MLCAYSIGAPIGAGLISREKYYDPLHCDQYIHCDANIKGDFKYNIYFHYIKTPWGGTH